MIYDYTETCPFCGGTAHFYFGLDIVICGCGAQHSGQWVRLDKNGQAEPKPSKDGQKDRQ